MSKFGNTLFSGSHFIFWCLAPALVGFVACLFVVAWTRQNLPTSIGLVVAASLAALLIAGLWSPRRNRWALRCVAGFVFLAYAGYLVAELLRDIEPSLPNSRSTPSVLNALTGLIVIGIPCLVFTLRGAFRDPQSGEAEGLEERIPGLKDLIQ